MRLITLVQENNLDGRSERHVAHVYALANVVRANVADLTAPVSGHGLVALINIVLVVAISAQHPRGHVSTLGQ